MKAVSREVLSRQEGPHPRLRETVEKHLTSSWKKPVADHSIRAFEEVAERVQAWNGPLVLDTGCGTGASTANLATRFPKALIIGVDKSQDRLDRRVRLPMTNTIFVRADLEDFWLLAEKQGWKFDLQCFYYPNPWPKPEQRLRRWPFHPVLPTALRCGGIWELRTNWKIYADEFALALEWTTGLKAPVEVWNPLVPETLFEKKYQESDHELWRWVSPGPVKLREPGPRSS